MAYLLIIFCWLSICALAYTYVLYPLLLRFLAKGKTLRNPRFQTDDPWPQVSILMAVHNEEKVIRQKLDSLLAQQYPGKIDIYIGSDNSSDATNSILGQYNQLYPHLHIFPYQSRQGKPGVINQLAMAAADRFAISDHHIFIITDASVILSPMVAQQLVQHFKTPNMAIVDAHMVHTGMQEEDISHSENHYISWEGELKQNESICWQKMVGPFGGCYAMRSDYFVPVPDNFLVDDFYITMQAFRQGGLAISEPQAICYEPVGHEMKEEFRRKARISAGNIQNLFTFRDLWLPPVGLPNFAFFSHKVLRWLGPIWLLLPLVCAYLLADNQFYLGLFLLLISGYVFIPLMDLLLSKLGIHWSLLRNIRYFLTMNLALFAGYYRYAKGIKTNVWQPPKRQ